MGFGRTGGIIAGEIDLSFAAVYGLSTNIVAVLWVTHAVPVYLAILIAFLAAIGVGIFNAFFTAVVKIPSFIATLGSSTLVFGLTLYIGQTQNLSYQYPPPGRTVPHSDASFFTNLGTPRFREVSGGGHLGVACCSSSASAHSHAVRLPAEGDWRQPRSCGGRAPPVKR